jgi:hypothetical protein
MDEARAVLARLERIESLDRRGAPAPILLAELRELVVEAEAWVRVEPGVTAREERAVERLREAVSGAPIPALGAGRTLLA